MDGYSHVWVSYIFHAATNRSVKATVRPPALGGRRIGVFATRSPHRPSPIGLSLAKIVRTRIADGATGSILLAGCDAIEGTPVVDLKPWIPGADMPTVQHASCATSNRRERWTSPGSGKHDTEIEIE